MVTLAKYMRGRKSVRHWWRERGGALVAVPQGGGVSGVAQSVVVAEAVVAVSAVLAAAAGAVAGAVPLSVAVVAASGGYWCQRP